MAGATKLLRVARNFPIFYLFPLDSIEYFCDAQKLVRKCRCRHCAASPLSINLLVKQCSLKKRYFQPLVLILILKPSPHNYCTYMPVFSCSYSYSYSYE